MPAIVCTLIIEKKTHNAIQERLTTQNDDAKTWAKRLEKSWLSNVQLPKPPPRVTRNGVSPITNLFHLGKKVT